MNVDSADSDSLIALVPEEFQRYERYLASAYAIGFLAFTMLLFPSSAWPGALGLLVVVAAAFRRYHVVVHQFAGVPSPATDHAVQLWGTAAQACVWGSIPIVLALTALQFAGG